MWRMSPWAGVTNVCDARPRDCEAGRRLFSPPPRSPPMLSAARSGALARWRPRETLLPRLLSSSAASPPARQAALLELPEVEKVLRDVRAGDVRVFPVGEGGLHGGSCADYMVVATGRSDWHVRNIAQALLYKARAPPSNPLDQGFTSLVWESLWF